jgi:hypothetical protein
VLATRCPRELAAQATINEIPDGIRYSMRDEEEGGGGGAIKSNKRREKREALALATRSLRGWQRRPLAGN